MFDNLKDRFAKLEEDHESVRNVKQHVEKYQVVYATVGGSAITLVAVKLFGRPQVIVKGASDIPAMINNTVAPVINNAPIFNNDNSSVVNFGGHLTKIVKRIEDDTIWEKVKEAAEAIAEEEGVPFERAHWLLSRHLNGHIPNVYGVEYKSIGISTTG